MTPVVNYFYSTDYKNGCMSKETLQDFKQSCKETLQPNKAESEKNYEQRKKI